MDGAMEQCELPSFQPNSIAGDDLGLTLSPGSQSQMPESWLQDGNALDLGIDIGLDFDPFTDFGQLVSQLDGSNKRTRDDLDDLFEEGCSSPEPKKQNTGDQQLSPALDKSLNIGSMNEASILSHAAPDAHATASASSAIQKKFCLGQQSIAYHAAVEAMVHRPDPKHISPYGSVGYRPSAPGLHSMRIATEVSHDTLHNRLLNSRRRVDVLTAERNRYRDALLKYTSIDPKTGRLGIHVQEAELATLRRVCTTQQQRAKNFKAEIEEWKGKYVKLAQTHNSLVRDYQQYTSSGTAEKPNVPNEWEGRYTQLSQAYNDLLGMCAQLSPSIQIAPLRQSWKHPESNPARDPSMSAIQHPAPSNTNISYPSPPTSTSSPIHLSATVLPQLSPDLPEDPAALDLHSQPHHTEDFAPRAPTNSPIHPSTAGSVTMNNNTVFTINLAHGVTAANARPINNPMNSTANFYHSHAVSPKEVEVIDLTTDDLDTEKVSTQGFAPVRNVQDTPLTKFHREFRKKDLKWLHQVSDHDAVDKVFDSLNPHHKKKVYENGLGICYNLLETQKHIRRNLGGPFNDPTNDLLVSASAALENHVAVNAALVHAAIAMKKNAARSAARSAAKSTTKLTVTAITKTTTKITTKPTITSSIKVIKAAKASVKSAIETAVEFATKPHTPEPDDPAAVAAVQAGFYNPTDDDLGRMIEDEMLQEMMDREMEDMEVMKTVIF